MLPIAESTAGTNMPINSMKEPANVAESNIRDMENLEIEFFGFFEVKYNICATAIYAIIRPHIHVYSEFSSLGRFGNSGTYESRDRPCNRGTIKPQLAGMQAQKSCRRSSQGEGAYRKAHGCLEFIHKRDGVSPDMILDCRHGTLLHQTAHSAPGRSTPTDRTRARRTPILSKACRARCCVYRKIVPLPSAANTVPAAGERPHAAGAAISSPSSSKAPSFGAATSPLRLSNAA